jgi:Acyl-protein synthetase, LuxE
MISHQTFSDLAAQLREFIGRHSGRLPLAPTSNQELDFNRLALSLFAFQYPHNPPFRRFCESRQVSPNTIEHWLQIPAIPAVAFKEFELTSLPVAQRARVFHSSGTSAQHPGRHFHDAESLSLYEASLLPWFQTHLLQESCFAIPHSALGTPHSNVRFLSLTPTPELAPHSSLVHMFATIHRQFGSPDSAFTGLLDPDAAWHVNLAQSLAVLRDAIAARQPIIVMGTAFNFVQLADHLEDAGRQLALPVGSRILETGGYKGRTRSLSKPELHALITRTLGVPPSRIVSEYGMSELSSQAYDVALPAQAVAAVYDRRNFERVFQFPPWARAQIISPETGREVADGETGLIRVFDLANLRSVLAVQTEDLGIRRGDGFELLGRAALAEARGCSLMSA